MQQLRRAVVGYCLQKPFRPSSGRLAIMSHKNPPLYHHIDGAEDPAKYRPGGLHPVLTGDTFKGGRYRVVHKLGFGGSSTIWLARDAFRARYIALKICSAYTTAEGREAAIRQRLAAAGDVNTAGAARSARPLVQELLDTFDITGVNGQHQCQASIPARMSLRDAKEASDTRLFGLKTARSVAAQLIRSLRYIHRHGFVHGDLHPGNILFTLDDAFDRLTEEDIYERYGHPELAPVLRVDGKTPGDGVPSHLVLPVWLGAACEELQPADTVAVVADFGESFSNDDKTRYISHTPLSYRPPESQTGVALGPSADIWSLGCVLWDLFADRPLFDSWGATEDEVLADQTRLLGGKPAEWGPDQERDVIARRVPSTVPPQWVEMVEDDIRRPRRHAGGVNMGDVELAALVEMLSSMLVLDPSRRVTAAQLFESRWMSDWGPGPSER